MAKVIILLGIILAAAHSGFGLTCYSCDSSKGLTCDYGLLSFTYNTVDCEAEAGKVYSALNNLAGSLISHSCVKLTGKDKEGRMQTARTCAPYSSLTGNALCQGIAKSSQVLGDDIQELNCYSCTTDKCNSAPSVGGAFTIFSVVVCSIAMFLIN